MERFRDFFNQVSARLVERQSTLLEGDDPEAIGSVLYEKLPEELKDVAKQFITTLRRWNEFKVKVAELRGSVEDYGKELDKKMSEYGVREIRARDLIIKVTEEMSKANISYKKITEELLGVIEKFDAEVANQQRRFITEQKVASKKMQRVLQVVNKVGRRLGVQLKLGESVSDIMTALKKVVGAVVAWLKDVIADIDSAWDEFEKNLKACSK